MALPCLIFEDEHLLVVSKPAGLNTHAPDPYAGEGLYDWLRHREPRWANLAIIHRLDKETSGVMVFAKTPLANRSLTDQFTRRIVSKQYLLSTDRPIPKQPITVRSTLVRAGQKYVSRPSMAGGQIAETRFDPVAADVSRQVLGSLQLRLLAQPVASPQTREKSANEWSEQERASSPQPSPPKEEREKAAGRVRWSPAARLAGSDSPHVCSYSVLIAEPLTGRTHQIRAHAAEKGFPILGDTLYGGSPAQRVFLHAGELRLHHPATGEELTFRAPPDFGADPRLVLRAALIDPDSTNALRLVQGASDGWPGWYVERHGEYLVSQGEEPLSPAQRERLALLMTSFACSGAYHKHLIRRVRQTNLTAASPRLELGTEALERFVVHENGLKFELSFAEGYSAGLFLDQRDNRRRLLTGHVGAGFELYPGGGDRQRLPAPTVLNAFSYTCGFSVAAAKAGARTISLDLSKKYLEWGKRNFELNELEPASHDFIYGDVFDWLRRLAKKGRRYDVILLDPPTFSQSKASGVLKVERDYGKLVKAALPLLNSGGVLFASTNAAGWPPAQFLGTISETIRSAGRKLLQRQYAPQPPDFPVSSAEPAYLKTVWLRLG